MKKNPKQPPILFAETQSTISKIEKLLKAPLITYYNSNAGNVCENDAIAFYRLLKGKKFKKLYFCIKSDGGSSVVSDSSRPHGVQPTRLLRPWDFAGKSTGVGCQRHY